MSVVTVFAPEQKLRNHQVTGCVSLRAFRDILTELYSSAEFHPDMNALWDLRQADFSGILPEDVRELMHVVVSLWGRGGNCHSAVLVASATEFGIVRTYVSQFGRNAPCEIRVFLDPVEAHRWLGLGEATDVTNPRPRPPLNA
ncbi:MAG TPA: hypothetical protein VG734_16105 [Lacunisphaera sp.]|nr:hypothetical protein [Lacunisphaera sp.]